MRVQKFKTLLPTLKGESGSTPLFFSENFRGVKTWTAPALDSDKLIFKNLCWEISSLQDTCVCVSCCSRRGFHSMRGTKTEFISRWTRDIYAPMTKSLNKANGWYIWSLRKHSVRWQVEFKRQECLGVVDRQLWRCTYCHGSVTFRGMVTKVKVH